MFSFVVCLLKVLDEADVILNMDSAALETITNFIPKERNTYLFTATMTKKVEKFQRAFLRHPVKVEVSSKYKTVDNLDQFYLETPLKFKDLYLVQVLKTLDGSSRIMIFCETCMGAVRLALTLQNLHFYVIPFHGQMNQEERLKSLEKFKSSSRHNILVATDLAARGLDIPHVDVVINADIPTHPKTYIHRVGRTARAGRAGKAITILTQ